MMNVVKNTVCDILLKRVEANPQLGAIGSIEKNQIQVMSFENYKNLIESISIALLNLGLKQQSKVCILSHTRKDWHLLDMSVLCTGAITVPIYPNYPAKDIKYILEHSEAELLIIEGESQLEKILPIMDEIKNVTKIISIEGISESLRGKLPLDKTFLSYEEVIQIGIKELETQPDLFQLTIQNISETSVATIVYTSGTTGEPKGAVITHMALFQVLKNIKKFSHTAFHEKDRLLTFLPLSHVLGRCESFFPLIFGCEAIYTRANENLLNDIQLVKPTLMVAVPRIFEKIYEKVMQEISKNPLKKQLYTWAMKVTNQYFEYIDNDKTPKSLVLIEYHLAWKLVFQEIYSQFGGKLRFFISGGAPLGVEIIKFLRNSRLTILEGYGLTETVAPCCVNPLNKQIPGTVGQPMGDVEIKFLEDGEILLKSKAMFKEYYKNPAATAEVLDNEGWFHTGDIGIINSQGFLKITDRKKDLIITSGGKNIAPQKIELLLKQSPYIDHALIIGDKKKFISALIGLNKAQVEKHFVEFEISDDSELKELANHPEIQKLIQKEITLINEELASFESVKRFKILPIPLSTEDYLTPSLKLKKKQLAKDYDNLINAMYKNS